MSLIRLNPRPSPKQLLVFALGWLGFVGLLGLAFWKRGHPTVAASCWIMALGVPAAGAVWREGIRLLYVGLSYATYPIGLVVSSVVLITLYYVILTPIGLLLRLWGHDALQRRFDPEAGSYWHKRPRSPQAPDRYFRLH
jgi:hypothetical protein